MNSLPRITRISRMKDISPQRHPAASPRASSDTEKTTEEKIRKKTLAGKMNAAGFRFGIVVSRFNEFITERLLRSAYDGLLRSGAGEKDIQIVRVPGSFEIPSAARTLAAVEMASLKKGVSRQPSAFSKGKRQNRSAGSKKPKSKS